jgi:hypothetical protein
VLRGVSGGVQHLDGDLPHLQPRPVVHFPHRIAEFGTGAGQQLYFVAGGQLANPGEVVVVLVGVTGVADAHALAARRFEVEVHVPAHIEHQRLAGLLRTEKIGGVAQALEVELFEKHLVPPGGRRPRITRCLTYL